MPQRTAWSHSRFTEMSANTTGETTKETILSFNLSFSDVHVEIDIWLWTLPMFGISRLRFIKALGKHNIGGSPYPVGGSPYPNRTPTWFSSHQRQPAVAVLQCGRRRDRGWDQAWTGGGGGAGEAAGWARFHKTELLWPFACPVAELCYSLECAGLCLMILNTSPGAAGLGPPGIGAPCIGALLLGVGPLSLVALEIFPMGPLIGRGAAGPGINAPLMSGNALDSVWSLNWVLKF